MGGVAVRAATSSRCIVTALLATVPLPASSQEPPGIQVVEPCRDACELMLLPEGDYGEDAGPGMIGARAARGWLDESGRMYLLGSDGASVMVFGADGTFLRRVGRRGSGPGEFEDARSLVITGDGVFSVTDRDRGLILTFDRTGELVREVRPVGGWFPIGSATVHFDGATAVHHADLRTTDLIGYPLHLVNLESGRVEASFGSLTGEYDGRWGFNQVIARGPGRSVWIAEKYGYAIDLWEPDRLLRSLRREAEWFPELRGPEELAHGWNQRPNPVTVAIAADDSLIWMAFHTADENWEEGGMSRDRDRFNDTMLEVIDWRQGRVVASQRFDAAYHHWVRPGLLGRLVVTPEGSVRYRTTRVLLAGR